MAVKCEHIKENGEQCRSYAVWGLEPPRCPRHRLDGAATGSTMAGENIAILSKYYYGSQRFRALKRQEPKTRLAKLYTQFHFLDQGVRAAQEAEDYKQLLRLTQRKTDVVMRIVAEIEEFGGRLTDDALELTEVMVRKIEAERKEVEKKLHERRFGSLKRSPGYWAVYNFIREYIKMYHISPKYKEIVKGTGLGSRGTALHYIKQLEGDGFVERIPGERRNIRLIE